MVVSSLSTHKFDEHGADWNLNHGHQAVAVSFDIEDVMIFGDPINMVESLFDIARTGPIGSKCFHTALIQGCSRIFVGIASDDRFAENNHVDANEELQPVGAAFKN